MPWNIQELSDSLGLFIHTPSPKTLSSASAGVGLVGKGAGDYIGRLEPIWWWVLNVSPREDRSHSAATLVTWQEMGSVRFGTGAYRANVWKRPEEQWRPSKCVLGTGDQPKNNRISLLKKTTQVISMTRKHRGPYSSWGGSCLIGWLYATNKVLCA